MVLVKNESSKTVRVFYDNKMIHGITDGFIIAGGQIALIGDFATGNTTSGISFSSPTWDGKRRFRWQYPCRRIKSMKLLSR
jgi:hypothetical protein